MLRLTVVWKINLLVLGGLALLLGSSVTFGLIQSQTLGESRVQLALTGSGVAASLVLVPSEVVALTPEAADTDAYRRSEASLRRLAEAFGLSDLYVLRPRGDQWEFVFDTADGPFDDSGMAGGFSVYDSPPGEVALAWRSDKPVVTSQPYTDEFGTFRSSFVVLLEGQTPVALIGSDFNLVQLVAARDQQVILSAVLALGGLVMLALLAWVLVRMIDRPLSRVSRRFTALAAGTADFSDHVAVTSRDELGDLATGFNRFVEKLGVLVADLRAGVSETGKIQLLLQRDSEETAITLAQTRQGLEALTASGSLLESSIQEVLTSLEAMSAQGANLDGLARSQQETTERVAQDQAVLDEEARTLRGQSAAVGKALADLDRESLENTQRMEGELRLLRQLSGAVEAVHGIVATLVNTAESTGLLAMNASIEAAHAGLQGRGFAVIAQRMRLQAETSRLDADRIGGTLQGMVDLISEAAAAAQETAHGAEVTHAKIEAAKGLVDRLTASGENLEAFSRRNREAAESLREASRGVAQASGGVASGTQDITASTRSLQEVSMAVLGGAETILGGANHLAAVVEDIGEVANRLTVVSQSLEENLRRIQSS